MTNSQLDFHHFMRQDLSTKPFVWHYMCINYFHPQNTTKTTNKWASHQHFFLCVYLLCTSYTNVFGIKTESLKYISNKNKRFRVLWSHFVNMQPNVLLKRGKYRKPKQSPVEGVFGSVCHADANHRKAKNVSKLQVVVLIYHMHR